MVFYVINGCFERNLFILKGQNKSYGLVTEIHFYFQKIISLAY